MTKDKFFKTFYEQRKTKTSEAVRLMLTKKLKMKQASDQTGADMAAITRLLKKLTVA